ncbi:zinc finger MYM-type protein 1-like [Tenrec ecaudatus]|uniref:zinc finger MYM-type protein 1-like n=1 Tax=Tenrec ecaudatus TaxID=94439 RepID=UPI003F5A54F9
MKRQQLSGALKRKLTEGPKQRVYDSLETTPKLTSFVPCLDSEETSFLERSSSVAASRRAGTASAEVTNSNTGGRESVPSRAATPSCRKRASNGIESDIGVGSEMVSSADLVQNRSTDPALWNHFSSNDVNYWIVRGPSDCQHHSGPFENSCRKFLDGKQTRFCSQNIFLGCKANGESYKREWLLYSPSVGSVYCFVCKLFSPKSFNSQFATDGFSDWRNSNMIDKHENSSAHRECMLSYLHRRQALGPGRELATKVCEERQYQKAVLQRVVAVITTIADLGLPFHGREEEVFGSPRNGKFWGLLELVAQFDPFLAGHISKYGGPGKGNPLCVSDTTCEELIYLMIDKVRSAISREISLAGYFTLLVDSTPDLATSDRLSVVVRYVSPTDGKPVERFIMFTSLKSHTGEEVANEVLRDLREVCKVDFAKCRGLTYDDAASMSECYRGVQQKLLEHNKYAISIPCAAHSLNLIARSAVDCCPEAVDFFSTVQLLSTFFTTSPQRWAVLKKYVGSDRVLKCLSHTHGDVHVVATSAILESYTQILEALEDIVEDPAQKGNTRREAENLANKMQRLECVFMLVLWNNILQHFHWLSQALQDSEVNLKTCTHLYQSLTGYSQSLRQDFERFENTATQILPDTDYQAVRHRRRLSREGGKDAGAPEEALSARDQFHTVTYNTVIDALDSCMKRRADTYEVLSDRFSFLNNMDLPDEECMAAARKLVQAYPNDLNTNLYGEVRQFHSYMRTKFTDSSRMNFTHVALYDSIVGDKIQCVFPNVEIALRMFLTLMITNCTVERSFSSLKRLKSPQPTAMIPESLDSFSLLCMEIDILRQLNSDEIIEEFLRAKDKKQCS